MKTVNKLVVLFSLASLMTSAVSAKSLEQTYLDTCRKGADVPVPVTVVTPCVSSDYIGTTVEIEFIVDTAGIPSALSVKSAKDSVLAEAVVDAVKQWRFRPAKANGSPVATKVVLPMKIVDSEVVGARYAVN